LLLEATSSSLKVVPVRFVARNFTSLEPGRAGDFGRHGSSCTTRPTSWSRPRARARKGYAFRFTAPGFYAVQVVPPPGCSAQAPVTLDIKMLDEVRVDFGLSAQ
jgi:hypothetical protein